jgi:hypothetical protein
MKKLIDLTTLTKGAQPKSNLTKKLLGLVGVASASIFLSFPVWASLTDSTSDLVISYRGNNPTTGGGRTTDFKCLNNPNPECSSQSPDNT